MHCKNRDKQNQKDEFLESIFTRAEKDKKKKEKNK